MKKIILLVAVVLSSAMFAGCEGNAPPMKPGGGGLPQPYNPGNGQYIPGK